MATRAANTLTRSSDVQHEDHRKRKRNRTSKSCINCRMAKRQCDRQRPACQRCVSLGLTGLCAFEVDEASASSDPLDENARLRRRIAELERVIRELQKKPHPRWAPSGLSSTDSAILSAEPASELEHKPSPDELEPEVTDGITLTLPFVGGERAQQTSDAPSTGESITSSSGASTPPELPPWSLQPTLPPSRHPLPSTHEEWYRLNNRPQPPNQVTQTAPSDLGYNEHEFTQHHPSYRDMTAVEYPGDLARSPSTSGLTAGSDSNKRHIYRYPQWPTISLGDDVTS